MSTNTSTGQKSSGTTDAQIETEPTTIDGPIPEFNAYDEYTGYDYYRCTDCGAEAMRRRDLKRTTCEEGH